MGSDWTSGPAKWAAVGALGCASVFGLAWSVANHAPAPVARAAAPGPVADVPPAAAPILTQPAAETPQPPAPVPKATRTVNLNTATKAELELLPSIGPALAGRILEERAKLGRFSSVEQLDDVKGIGPKLMEKLRPLVRVE